MDKFETTMDGLAAIGVATYLAVVLIRGNLKPLLSEVTKEAGFLEFLVAIFILYELTKIEAVKPFTVPLVGAAVLILVLRVVGGTNQNAFKSFASGRIGLFDLITSMFQKG